MKLELAFLKTLARLKKVYYGGKAYDFTDEEGRERLKDRDPRGQMIWKLSDKAVEAPVAVPPAVKPQPEIRQEDVGVTRLPASMRGLKPGRKVVKPDAAGDTDSAGALVGTEAEVVEGGVAL